MQGKEIRISGSKAILARAASSGVGDDPPAVLSFFGDTPNKTDGGRIELAERVGFEPTVGQSLGSRYRSVVLNLTNNAVHFGPLIGTTNLKS